MITVFDSPEYCEYSWIAKKFCAHCRGDVPDFDMGASMR